MCKNCESFVNKVRNFLGEIRPTFVEKLGAFIDSWKTGFFFTNFYQQTPQTTQSFSPLYFRKLSTISTPYSATTKLKKGIE